MPLRKALALPAYGSLCRRGAFRPDGARGPGVCVFAARAPAWNPMRTRIKICGLTREQDIDAAVSAGVDAIGFVFYPKSKRCLTPARCRRVPAFVDVVALFVNPADDEVRAVLDQVGPELLQFHGDETPQQCAHHGQRFLRAFRVGARLDTAAGLARNAVPTAKPRAGCSTATAPAMAAAAWPSITHCSTKCAPIPCRVRSSCRRPEAGKRGPGGAAAMGRRCKQRRRGRARNKSSDRISVFVAATQEADAN